jgi:hypothetical protein
VSAALGRTPFARYGDETRIAARSPASLPAKAIPTGLGA